MRITNFLHMNQYNIEINNVVYFQSYDSTIAKVSYENGAKILTLGRDWDYSNTTLRHLYAWLYENFNGWQGKKKDVEKMIASGQHNGKKVVYVNEKNFD